MNRSVPAWSAIVAAALPMFMATLDNLVVTSALPAVHADFGSSVEELQWITNAYTLSFAALILLAVALGDRFGRRRVFVAGVAVFSFASVFAALSSDSAALIVWRAVQGAGAAAILPLSLTLLVASVPDRLRAVSIGIWSGISGLGVALGPLVGGAVVEGWSWEAIFWLNIPVGAIAIPLAILALPNGRGARVPADLIGVLLAGLGVLGVVFGVVNGNESGWTSGRVLTGLIGGAVLLVAFVFWQTRASAPLLPLRLFRDRSFTLANIVAMTFSFGAFGAVFILIQFLQIVQGRTPFEAGVWTTPWTLAPMVVAPLAGLIAPRVGTRALIVGGMAFLGGGLFWMGAVLDADASFLSLLPGFVLAGVGMGAVFGPISSVVLSGMPQRDHAKASGTNSTLREIGVALGIAVLTAVFTGSGGELSPTGYVDAARPAVMVGAAVVAASALLAILLPAGRGSASAGAEAPLARKAEPQAASPARS